MPGPDGQQKGEEGSCGAIEKEMVGCLLAFGFPLNSKHQPEKPSAVWRNSHISVSFIPGFFGVAKGKQNENQLF